MKGKSAPVKKPKKSAALKRHKMRCEEGRMYANFDETNDCFIYIGGRYYQDIAQIHLNRNEAIALRVWLNKNVRGRK